MCLVIFVFYLKSVFKTWIINKKLILNVHITYIEFITLDNFWRRVVDVIMRLVIFVPLEACVDPIEEAWFSRSVFVSPEEGLVVHIHLDAKLGFIVVHSFARPLLELSLLIRLKREREPVIDDMESRFTLMLLVANWPLQNTAKETRKWLEHWHIGIHLRVLSESFPMNTNMTGFKCLKKICFGRKKPQNSETWHSKWAIMNFLWI